MKIHFHAADTEKAQNALQALEVSYGNTPLEESDIIVVLGGDGTMLGALHKVATREKPVYGMNLGIVGFLMNPFNPEDLVRQIEKSHRIEIHPLHMIATDVHGIRHESLAYNEVSLLRETRQAARLKISVEDIVRIPELVGDGILLSTPAGSTAYNSSARGPIMPLSSNMLALTPLSAFRPRRWSGALLPCTVNVRVDVLESRKRPVSVAADSHEYRDIIRVDIRQSETGARTLCFDPEHSLEERILKEQFTH